MVPSRAPKAYLAGARLLPSFLLIAFILVLYASVIGVLWGYNQDGSSLWHSSRFWHVVRFTSLQALISTLISLFLGYLLARALFELSFPGKTWILRILSISFVLPTLVVVFAILGVFGYTGFLNNWVRALNPDWAWNVYGWPGILLAHVFYNFPMVAQLLYQRLEQVPGPQRQLSAQLGLSRLRVFKWLEWPYLKGQTLSVALLVFTLCFSSFGIVLVLGGGPRFSTLEVQIYQALNTLDLHQAAWYTFMQVSASFLLFWLAQTLSSRQATLATSSAPAWRMPIRSRLYQSALAVVAFIALLFFAIPLLNIVYAAIHGLFYSRTLNLGDLLSATLNSSWIGLGSAVLTLLFAYALLHAVRVMQSQSRLAQRLAHVMMSVGMVSLWMPALVLAVGLFILLHNYLTTAFSLLLLLFVCNAIKTLPFVLRILQAPMQMHYHKTRSLSQMLGLSHWQQFRWVEWPTLRPFFLYAFALTFTLSMGDFTIIAFFGSFQLDALPLLLYQQMGRYQFEAAGVTTGVMLLYSVLLFVFIQRWQPKETV